MKLYGKNRDKKNKNTQKIIKHSKSSNKNGKKNNHIVMFRHVLE